MLSSNELGQDVTHKSKQNGEISVMELMILLSNLQLQHHKCERCHQSSLLILPRADAVCNGIYPRPSWYVLLRPENLKLQDRSSSLKYYGESHRLENISLWFGCHECTALMTNCCRRELIQEKHFGLSECCWGECWLIQSLSFPRMWIYDGVCLFGVEKAEIKGAG